jgi:hypothetical protein
MTDLPMSPAVLHGAETHAAGGGVAAGAASALGVAAAPVFAMLALWTALSGTQPGVLCMDMQGASQLSGMTLRYALMSIFHAAPWIKLVSSR